MIISILGGGNIGTLIAAELAIRGHSVRIFASRPDLWSPFIEIYSRDDKLLGQGEISLVTNDLDLAIGDADLIFITYPSFMLQQTANQLLPLVSQNQTICVVPGGNAEFFFHEHIKKGATLVGLQRVHSIARLKEKGHSVYMLGRKNEIQVSALPTAKKSYAAILMSELFDMPAIELSHFLVETLTPSNPILHTARLRQLFAEWKPGVTYTRIPLFYEEWNLAASQLLIKCDEELQQICRSLERKLRIDLSEVRPLTEHYESPDPKSMTAKLMSIPAFKGIASPMAKTNDGKWVPDFSSRYFKADFAFGLKSIKDIGGLAGVSTPCIDNSYEWYASLTKNETFFQLPVETLDELAVLYS